MRIELRPQGAELGFGGEASHVVFAAVALVTLLADAQLVDAPANEHRRRVEESDVVRHQSPARGERCDVENVSGGVVRRHQHVGAARSGGRGQWAAVKASDLRYLPPFDGARDERGREAPAHVVERLVRRRGARERPGDRMPHPAIVDPV